MSGGSFGEGTGPILSATTCTGGEANLEECTLGSIGAVNCYHGRGAGVICKGNVSIPAHALLAVFQTAH